MDTKTSTFKYLPYVMALFCVIVVLSNTVAVKLIKVGPLVATAGSILFPLSYVLGDVITEVYGYEKSRNIFWMGVFCNILMAVVYMITASFTGIIPDLDPQYSRVLGQVPRIVIASMIGIFMGQHTNAFVMSKMKIIHRGRWLPIRTIASTIVGEGVDTMFFATLAFAGTVPMATLGRMVWTMTVLKTVYETLVTPATYVVSNALKKVEGDRYDYGVDYNPFRFFKQN